MILKEIDNKELWNKFIINLNPEFYSFLQSWEWWELQEKLWKKIVRLWIHNQDKELIWVMLVLKNYAKRGNYYFVPHWPIIKWDIKESISRIITELKQIAKKDKMSFIRFNSTLKNKFRKTYE